MLVDHLFVCTVAMRCVGLISKLLKCSDPKYSMQLANARRRTTHNAIIVLQVLTKSRALSAEYLLVLLHSVLSALKCVRFAVH